jgi:hypothetical protein
VQSMDRTRVGLGSGAVAALIGSMLLVACESSTAFSVPPDIATSLSITVNGTDPSQGASQQLELELGDTITVSAVAMNPLGFAVSPGTVIWSSSNTSVAQINGAGLVSAVGVGSAEIRAAAGEAVSSLPAIVGDTAAF